MAEHDGMLDRRQFLAGASVAAWLSVTHAHGLGRAVPGRPDTSGRGRVARIDRLRLETAAPLSEMEEFYGRLLGLDVMDEGSAGLSIEAGESRIQFVPAESGGVATPFYHFAFNIPENKLLLASEWQRQRTPLIAPDAGLRDPRFPDDVVHFANWNAHSVFFWDPGGNLVEHIARHDLQNAAAGPFTSRDILYASEIGLIADDVPALAGDLQKTFGLEAYRGGSDQFTAVGDEIGLLLVMKRGRNLGFGEGRPAGVFATAVTLRAARLATYSAPGFPFEISSR